MIPVTTKDGYIITVEKLPEHITMLDHFITECGWSESELEGMYEDNFFCAKVAAWKNGEVYGEAYLGCCYYESIQEFINESGYFDDMVNDVLIDAKQSEFGKIAV